MGKDLHFRALENTYLSAPINRFYSPTINDADGEASIEIAITEDLFHAAGAIRGSVYFKVLDDALKLFHNFGVLSRQVMAFSDVGLQVI